MITVSMTDAPYNFERFIGFKPRDRRHVLPQNMTVGQIVVRHHTKPGSISALKSLMRKAMRGGAEFSIDHGKDYFAIRRDK